MAISKCKCCGGDIIISQDKTYGICDHCGTTMTFPKFDDEQRLAAFNRGNAFRMQGEFDKALSVYERIIEENDADAEAHWCCVLCRFGIEYVEDPATAEYIPTCHRASFDSVLDDVDYKAAIEYSDGLTKKQYVRDAAKIAEVQRGILATSQNEEPFDVFISYKETDVNGNRTVDATLAQDIYYRLTEKGYRVFFSKITLEGKPGTEYEPYIFAALNSSKVMVLVGTSAENINAVWVKNEWSRFMAMRKKDRSKVLIPCYRDMDPYNLPEQISVLKAYDMSQIGFIQDLIHGVSKVVDYEKKEAETVHIEKETVIVNSSVSGNVAPLLKRAFIFLEDGEFDRADEFCEQVLNQDPECARAYLGKLMAELRVRKQENLKDCAQPFDDSNNYAKVLRFGDIALQNELTEDIGYINERNENARLTGIYNKALSNMNSANSEEAFKSAAVAFESIQGFKDADTIAKKCLEKAEICRKDAIYASAASQIKTSPGKKAAYESAIKIYKSISGWRDADEQILVCQRETEKIKAEEEAARLEAERKAEEARIASEKAAKKRKKIISITAPVAAVIIIFLVILSKVIIPNNKYSAALEMYNSGSYEEAITAFEELDGYKDSVNQIELCETGIKDNQYAAALAQYNLGNYEEAMAIFRGINEYKDVNKILSQFEMRNIEYSEVGDYIVFGSYEQDNDTSDGKEGIEWIVLEIKDGKLLVISRYALDCQPYNTEWEYVTWETCSLRKWMNNTFLKNAFSSEEQAMIGSTIVSADQSPYFDTDSGNMTTDEVFLLSINETEQYFASDDLRMCVPTEYAISQGAYTDSKYTIDGRATCRWWLRSPGEYQRLASCVYNSGLIFAYGERVTDSYLCVRPALWIDLSFAAIG